VTGEGGQYVTLTDIQGKEDHMGDMDFKVAGTANGITAIQLDMKVKSISYDVIYDALHQARDAREEILEHIEGTLPAYRSEMSKYAPRMESIKIAVDKIGAVIGPGGKMIRGIVDETGATIDIQDDGTIIIGSSDGNASERAKQMIRDLTKEIEIGEIYTGKVVRTTDFGAFIELLPGKDGMVHISELANYRVPTVEDEITVGDEVTVLVTDVDQTGRVRLSRRALLSDADEDGSDPVEAALRRQRAGRGGGGGQRRGGGGFGGDRGDRGPRRDGPGRGGPPRNRDRDRDFGGGRPRGRSRDYDGGGPGSAGRDQGRDRDRDRRRSYDDGNRSGNRPQPRGGFGGGDRDRGRGEGRGRRDRY
jgi:polyribonucleotide nucleotidyltransferase